MARRARPRGATPRPRSGAAAERSYTESVVRVAAKSARLWQRRSSREELPSPEARGRCRVELPHAGGREEQPHIQGAVAAQALEGLEELFHVQGQEGRWWDDTPHPR